jgi:hypothetical protein
MDTFEKEARLFTRYLIHRDAGPQAIRLYEDAVRSSQPDEADRRLLNFMTAHPGSIGLIDAGLVFHDASSEVRRRLYIMLAILEASPEQSDLFLAQKRSPWYVFAIGYFGVRAVAKAGLGLLLVKALA